MRIHSRSGVARSGFTLVELMIVIMIVLLLVALTTSAVLKFRNTGPYTATVMNMQKIKAAFDTQWKAVRDKAQKEPIPSNLVSFLNTQKKYKPPPPLPGGTPIASPSDLRVREEYINLKLAQAFPMGFEEVFNSPYRSVIPAYPPYLQYLSSRGITSSSTLDPWQQQGICLMMALEVGPSNAGITPDVLGTSAVVRIGSAYAVADAWGNPLLFTRYYLGSRFTPLLMSMGADGSRGISLKNPSDRTTGVIVRLANMADIADLELNTLSPDSSLLTEPVSPPTPKSSYAEDNVKSTD